MWVEAFPRNVPLPARDPLMRDTAVSRSATRMPVYQAHTGQSVGSMADLSTVPVTYSVPYRQVLPRPYPFF